MAIRPYLVWITSRTPYAAAAAVIVANIVTAAAVILQDRAGSISLAGERTRSLSRLLVAHGESAIEDAGKIMAAMDAPVRAWDLRDPNTGRELFEQLQSLIDGSPQIYAVWILDGRGDNVLDSRRFPPRALNGAERPYFRAHQEHAPEPVILGDPRPGSVSGKERFTFSRSQRNPDGTLRAVLAAGILSTYFDKLYAEAALWPGARAGLYSKDGTVLGRLQTVARASPEFIADVEAAIDHGPSGTVVLPDADGRRIVSWSRSAKYPSIYSTSSQPVELALADWRRRSLALAIAVGLATAAMVGLFVHGQRAAAASRRAELQNLLAREVDHRVKNSLQIVASLLSLRLRQTSDPAARGALADAAAQVAAIADVHEVIQSSTDLDQVDLCELIGSVCRGLGKGSPCEVVFQGTRKIAVDPRQATQVAVIVNELVTNALKHATSGVEVSCRYDGDTVLISVRDDGAGLPAGFDPIRQGRFGLPMASSLARRLGGSLTGHSTTPGTTWQVRLPLAKLATPAPDRGRFAQRRA